FPPLPAPPVTSQDAAMSERFYRVSRRKFLASTAALALTGSAPGAEAVAAPLTHPPRPDSRDRKPLAVLTTVYRPLSHAQHIAGRFLHGYSLQGSFHVPRHFVASLYADQRPDNDQSREVARDFKV